MKKLTKAIAAISAAAVLAIPANMSAFAYNVSTSNFTNPMVNKSKGGARGYSWDTYYQADLPVLWKKLLNANGKYTYYATTDTNGNEYGSTHMFAILHRGVADSANIQNAKKYIDNITIKSKKGFYYAPCVEYHNYSTADEPYDPDDPDDQPMFEYYDYGIRMMDGPYLQDIINKFTISSLSDLNYEYIKAHGEFTGALYLKNYYLAGLKLTSSDPYTRFDEPVLERNPDGIGFRTKVTFHVKKPVFDETIVFNNPSGYTGVEVLKNIKVSCNGSDTDKNCIQGYNSISVVNGVTLKVPNADYKNRNKLYQGLITCPTLTTEIKGEVKKRFLNSNFQTTRRVGNILYIYEGKNDTIGDPQWKNGTGSQKFEAFFRCGGRDELGHCAWIGEQLNSVTQVRFYSDSTPTSYGTQYYMCDPGYLKNRLAVG